MRNDLILLFGMAVAASVFGRSLDGTWEFRREGAAWQRVSVPHDWAIEGPFDTNTTERLAIDTARLPYRGRGEYRRTFSLTAEEQRLVKGGGTVYLAFDGVQAHPEVFVNGRRAGGWDYGYVSFTLDVTEFLREGENELRVLADTTTLSSRWYPGAGLYRSVHLKAKPRDHVVSGSIAVVPKLNADRTRATVEVAYVSSLYGPTNYAFTVDRPRLWSPENPQLYELDVAGERVTYGIREAMFTADDGFWLNGRRLQLKGVCLHSDLGPLGMAFNLSAEARRLRILKDMGVNAIRCSHNPPAPGLLDLCDRMGFVVWDECFDKWDGTAARGRANLEDFVERNLRAFVRRDRNHPCVVVWSIGNEIGNATPRDPSGVTRARCRRFREAVRWEDATRPVGLAAWEAVTVPALADLDLTGWNYARRYVPIRAAYPDKPIVYSESCSSFSDYGFYQVPPPQTRTDYATDVVRTDGYDMTAAYYSDIPDLEFRRVERDRFLAGEFVWTGFDYLGEPTPFADLGARSSYFGIVDLTGVPKDRFYLYRAYWNTAAETCHLVPGHWNFQTSRVPVFVYTSGDEAELFVNGKSLGRRRKSLTAEMNSLDNLPGDNDYRGDPRKNPYYAVCDRYRLRWYDVPFEPGELKVVAYRNGRRIGEDVRRTAAKPVAVRLARDPYSRPDDELVYVQVDLVDAHGVRDALAMNRVRFATSAGAEIVAVGNGDPRGADSFKATASHPLYFGKAVVILRRTGVPGVVPTLTAAAEGLRSATVELK